MRPGLASASILMVPPLSMLLLLFAADASAKKELVELCMDGVSPLGWLLLLLDPVAFLSMLDRLRLPASLLCFLAGLVVLPS